MSDLDRNLTDAINKASETGEKILTIECPCCHKIFYITEGEANYEVLNRNEQTDFGMDLKKFFGKKLGRKCPFCGFAAEFTPSDFLDLGREE